MESYSFTIGMLYEKYKNCCDCRNGLIDKKVEKRVTLYMGMGLFACENITKGTYIIKYKGEHLDTFKPDDCDYVAEVEYENKRERMVTFYIDVPRKIFKSLVL